MSAARRACPSCGGSIHFVETPDRRFRDDAFIETPHCSSCGRLEYWLVVVRERVFLLATDDQAFPLRDGLALQQVLSRYPIFKDGAIVLGAAA